MAVPSLSSVSPGLRPSFEVLDDVVRLAESNGVLAVRVADSRVALAAARHVERRALSAGRGVVRAAQSNSESPWRDIASRLGVRAHEDDASEIGRLLAARASAERAVVIAPLRARDAWGLAVLRAWSEHHGAALLVVLVLPDVELELRGASWFELDAELDDASLTRWWEAVAAVGRLHRGSTLAELDGWHAAARVVRPQPWLLPETPSARSLAHALALAGRPWPLLQLALLGDAGAVEELEALGLVEVRDGLLEIIELELPAASDRDAQVAHALVQAFPGDPWAHARSGELYARRGEVSRAEQALRHALSLAGDATSRAGLWQRWRQAIDALGGHQSELLLGGAELALGLGDVDVALDWAKAASTGEPSFRAAFVLGRASLARGDLVSADAALARARDLAQGADDRLDAVVAIGEVRYARGDLAEAERFAAQVLEAADSGRVRLGARNLLGKLLLARGNWAEADQHFAEDVCDAIALALSTEELRARVNRAIALLSRGSSDEAYAMLSGVLKDGEERGEPRAVAFALSNLAVLAIERHDYAAALELLERTSLVHRRLGDRLGFARDITNVVELRLRLGLVDQAEQALRFGRQALGAGAPASMLTELSLAAARVHLERGRTLEAEREVRSALRTAAHASDGDKLGECHRLAARIALEDGVVARAEAEAAHALEIAASPYDRAEAQLLVARAAGRGGEEPAREAIAIAREAGDEELAREAHVLAAEIAFGEGDTDAARGHLDAARALRDEVVAALPSDLRDAYLSRRDVMRVARLERLAHVEDDAPPLSSGSPASSSRPAKKKKSGPRYVGRHPSVRALLDSAERVAPTDNTVLLLGESGTGKELVAELIHDASARAQGPLVKVNCAALVESLLLSELFGHEKGAFTGAGARRRGRFERADGGTLFLDEIGDISPRTQVALLRVLEERTIERVGGTSPIPVDVRIVCATNRDLRTMVERGEFREDLYYRLSGIALSIPALRDRVSDLPMLAEALLERIARERREEPKALSRDALELLARHRWPGNVRELENALRAVSLFAVAEVIQVSDLVEHVEALRRVPTEAVVLDARHSTLPPPSAALPSEDGAFAEEPVTGAAYREIREGVSLSDLKRNIERECIARALAETGGNITRAASILGMKRPRLSQLVKQYGLLESSEDAS